MKEIVFSCGGVLIFITVMLMVNYFLKLKNWFDDKKYINFLVYLLLIEMLIVSVSQILIK